MGQGYTRNDVSNNIANGNVINAADLDGEFDAIESAFVAATGHTHDGTAAEGGAITVIGPVQDFVADATSFTAKTANAYDLGKTATRFKDAYINGVTYTGTINLNGTAITATAAELNKLDGATVTTSELNILDGVTATASEINILDGVTSTTAELNILDGVTSTASEINILDGATVTTAELNILDGVTATTAEINYIDGVTSSIQTQLDDKQPLSAVLTNTTASFTTADETKLDGIEAGAEVNVATNLGNSASGTGLSITSSTGTNTNLPAATTTAWGVMTDEDKTKLDGIESSAKDDQTITAGSGLTGGGTGDVTISHADTSTQSSVNNSGRTYIQDITLDTYGHVIGLTSATETVVDTNTNQLTTFQVEDGDGTEVTISHAKEWKFVEGTGSGASIDINWTDTDNGTDGDPFDLTFAVTNTDKGSSQNIFKNFTITDTDSGYTWAETGSVVADTNNDTITLVSGANVDIDIDATNDAIRISSTDTNTDTNTTYDLTVPASTTNIRLTGSDSSNDDITITGAGATTVTRISATELQISSTDTNTNTNQLTTFQVEDGDSTEVTISHGKEWKFVEGAGDGASININWTDVDNGTDGDPYDLTFAVTNTDKGSSQSIFKNFTVTDTDSGFSWSETGTATAEINNDTITLVSGANVDIDVDTTNDAIRISSTDTNTDTNTTYDLSIPASTTDIRLAGSDATNDDITITGAGSTTVTRISATELQISSTDTNTDTNTTYSISAVDSANDAIIRLTGSDTSTDDVKLVAGSNITLTPSGDNITISATDTNTDTNTTYDLTIPASTTDIRLAGSNATNDDITITGGTNVTVTRTSASELTISSTDTNTDTLGFNIVGASSTATANAAATDGNVWLNHIEGSTVKSNHNIKSGGATTVTSDANGDITISSTDTNTNQLTTFQVEDGDSTEVTISQGKEWKFVEGTGDGASININWTDVDNGTDADPYDLTFAVTNTDKGSSQNIFKTFTVSDTDSGYSWSETGSVVADTNSDTVTLISGANIDIDVDTTNDAIRISSTDTNTDTLQSIATNSTNSSQYITFVPNTSGAQTGRVDAGLTYNPSTNDLSVSGDVASTQFQRISDASLDLDGGGVGASDAVDFTTSEFISDIDKATVVSGSNGSALWLWDNGFLEEATSSVGQGAWALAGRIKDGQTAETYSTQSISGSTGDVSIHCDDFNVWYSPDGTTAPTAAMLFDGGNSTWTIVGDVTVDGALEGGRVLISESTASSSATIEFTSGFSSSYAYYELEFIGIKPSVDNAGFYMRFSDDGGSTFETVNYSSTRWVTNYGASSISVGSTTAYIYIATNGSPYGVGNNSSDATLNGSAKIYRFDDTVDTAVIATSTYGNSSGANVTNYSTGLYTQSAALNGIQIYPNTGNISSGTIRLYGVN